MQSPTLKKSARHRGGLTSGALPWLYVSTLVGFVVVASMLIYAGRKFNAESVAIQTQTKAISEQQVLSERLKTLATEHWFPGADMIDLKDRQSEATQQMKAVLARLEMLSESPELADFYSGDMKFYVEQMITSWGTAQYELRHISKVRIRRGGRELQRVQHACDQLLRSGAYLMQESLGAQQANQSKRTKLLYLFAGSLGLLGLIMLWSLWAASETRMEILALNLQLEERVAERTAELEKANMFLSNVQSSIGSALVVIDPQNKIISWNPASEKLWGLPRSQAEGRDVFSALPLEDPESFHSAVRKVHQTLQPVSLRELGLKDHRGEPAAAGWGNGSLVPMVGPLGELRGIVILVDDVTERIHARRELAARAEQIAETNSTLKRLNNDMEQFVYAASHDLRSPMVNMHGLTKKLDKTFEKVRERLNGHGRSADAEDSAEPSELRNLLDHDIPRLLLRINRSISKFGSIIDGLLRYSRTGREEYHCIEIDMAQEVARAIELYTATVEEKGVQIYVDDLPPAFGDPDAINKVLANLIENALKYLDPDRDGEIVVEGREQDDGMCAYFIRDNGVGIREGDLERVFKIFERVDSGNEKGEGLGLAIVKRIIERHGGEISVESRWNEGTTFWFTLPAVRADEPRVPARRENPAPGSVSR
ncbi:MAG: PAS domain-containing protein [Planctomycetes bacterium]|nr:PAS domain-containing protein [Planctomycetota bacterium]